MTPNTAADLSALALGQREIVLRLLCAMLIGAVIGTEREYTHRPAGMRTHMLVALGACSVMITSQLLFCQYYPYGAAPDPARLGAQVIAGVGFLGAGTILREGASIKGLTTAASVWTVTCLGLAVGAGYFRVGLIGMVCMLVTLVLFEWLQDKLMRSLSVQHRFRVTGTDVSAALELVNGQALAEDVYVSGLSVERGQEPYSYLHFLGTAKGRAAEERLRRFTSALSAGESVSAVTMEAEKGSR